MVSEIFFCIFCQFSVELIRFSISGLVCAYVDILFIHFSNFGRSIICFLQKVDFCCGANDFSLLMKEKQEETQKSCLFKYYDIIQPKVIVFFFRKFFHFVQLFLFKPIVCCMLPMKTSFCFFFSLFAA